VTAAPEPLLLYNGECAVCRAIAGWVERRGANLIERPIGDDPAALRALNPGLGIWDAYATIHLLMPDGSMKVGGEAVAEVLRRIPAMRPIAWTFAVELFGVRPFQLALDGAYTILADIRPLLGCESCGTPNPWVKAMQRVMRPMHKPSATRRKASAR
jgi:predicted DCC family thiol-disulfide oxidoreductase YuxK